MKNITIIIIASLILLNSCSDQEKKNEVTIEWLYSDEGKSIGSLYKTEWLDNNLLYLMDMRKPKEDRTILKINPLESQTIKPLINKNKVIESLMSLINNHDTIIHLDWPKSFSSDDKELPVSLSQKKYSGCLVLISFHVFPEYLPKVNLLLSSLLNFLNK